LYVSAGNAQYLVEVLDLIADGTLSSRITEIGFDDIGDGIGKLERGEVIGRLVDVLG